LILSKSFQSLIEKTQLLSIFFASIIGISFLSRDSGISSSSGNGISIDPVFDSQVDDISFHVSDRV
jgi:hypothetical protein